MVIPILFDDPEFLVIHKPAGMVVNRSKQARGETVQDWAEREIQIPKSPPKNLQEKNFYDRSGVVHRLDKDTSGILLLAKTSRSFDALQEQFAKRTVEKRYIALVYGIPPGEGKIQSPVGRLPWNRRKFGVIANGREAVTAFRVREIFQRENDSYALLDVRPLTGRTHQIRIHLKSIGHWVVGDRLYAGRKRIREEERFCHRLFLHASVLRFRHPTTGKDVSIECSLPEELERILQFLRESSTVKDM